MEITHHNAEDAGLKKRIAAFNKAADAHRIRNATVDDLPEFDADAMTALSVDDIAGNRFARLEQRLKHRQEAAELWKQRADLLELIQPELDRAEATASMALAEIRQLTDDNLEASGNGRASMPAMQAGCGYSEIAERQFIHRVNESTMVKDADAEHRKASAIAKLNQREIRRSTAERAAALDDLNAFLLHAMR